MKEVIVNKAHLEERNESSMITLIIWLFFCFTQMGNFEINKYLCHAVWFVWLASLILNNNSAFKIMTRKKRYLYLWGFLTFYFLSSSIAVGIPVAINRVIALLELSSPILMFDIYKRSSKKLKTFTLLSFVAIVVYNTIDLISTMNYYGAVGLRNVINIGAGDYLRNAFNWAYSWIFITMASIILFRTIYTQRGKKWLLLIALAFLLTGVFVVVRSLFMIAILMMLTGCVLVFFYGKRRWFLKASVALIVGLIVFVTSYSVVITQIGSFENGGEFLTERTEEVYHTIIGNQGRAHDLNARNDLSLISISTFLKNPLFGINHEVSEFDSVQYTMVGDHSEWIDNLALYGVFSLLLLAFLIKSAKFGSLQSTTIYIMYFITGLFNPIWYFPQNVVVFFFLPILFSLYAEWQQRGYPQISCTTSRYSRN